MARRLVEHYLSQGERQSRDVRIVRRQIAEQDRIGRLGALRQSITSTAMRLAWLVRCGALDVVDHQHLDGGPSSLPVSGPSSTSMALRIERLALPAGASAVLSATSSSWFHSSFRS